MRDGVGALPGQIVNLGGSEQRYRRQIGVGAFRFRDFQEMLRRAFVFFAERQGFGILVMNQVNGRGRRRVFQ